MIRTDPPGTPLSWVKTGVSTGVPDMFGNHSESMYEVKPGAGTTLSGSLISRKFFPVKAARTSANASKKAAEARVPLLKDSIVATTLLDQKDPEDQRNDHHCRGDLFPEVLLPEHA